MPTASGWILWDDAADEALALGLTRKQAQRQLWRGQRRGQQLSTWKLKRRTHQGKRARKLSLTD